MKDSLPSRKRESRDFDRAGSPEERPIAAANIHVPLVIRGQLVGEPELEFGGRGGACSFRTPDVRKHLATLVLRTPSSIADLYALRFHDLVDFLIELGSHLNLERNPHLQQAFEVSRQTSGLTDEILANVYRSFGRMFSRTSLVTMIERTIGARYLDGWVEETLPSGARVAIRAFGARAVHIVAGNHPAVSALTIARAALTRSDAIIKSPSNDPLTAAAIARTMIDMAPDHPVTRHLSVAYWKGGDAEVEDVLYQPQHIEKIVAWGGLQSISHIARYVQPGIDLITLDPKLSSTIIGAAAFRDEATMRQVAERLAHDVGAGNQEGCVNARVVYIETGTQPHGIETANRFGALLRAAILRLPAHVSGPAKVPNRELAEEVQALRLTSDEHRVIGGDAEGAVIVSQTNEPVDFARLLANRTANLVPVDTLDEPIRACNAYTQTIGIYPESVKLQIRDRLALHGAQRLVSLGYASNASLMPLAGPQDAIEPLRRMCRWVVDESSDPAQQPLAAYVAPIAAAGSF
jgi:Acyl-CoA reductase (LuxC)